MVEGLNRGQDGSLGERVKTLLVTGRFQYQLMHLSLG